MFLADLSHCAGSKAGTADELATNFRLVASSLFYERHFSKDIFPVLHRKAIPSVKWLGCINDKTTGYTQREDIKSKELDWEMQKSM